MTRGHDVLARQARATPASNCRTSTGVLPRRISEFPSDAEYVENVMWEQLQVLFVTINVPGGSNNDNDTWNAAAFGSAFAATGNTGDPLGKGDDEDARDDEYRAEQEPRADRLAEHQHAEGDRNDQAQLVDRCDSRCGCELQRAVVA